MTDDVLPTRSSTAPAYLAFAAFGSLWGVWGAALPAIRDQAGLDDGQLGTALLFIGAGALPAMPLAGRAADRFGRRVPAVTLLLMSAAGLLVALTAHGLPALCLGLAALGATSGAADVAINAVAVDVEQASGRPVVTRAHGTFSACVVVGSLLTGLLRQVAAPVAVGFGLVCAVAVLAAVRLVATPGHPAARRLPAGAPAGRHLAPLAVVGLVAALAFAVENAHQSWGAVYLGDVLAVSPGLTATAPALFAGVVAVTRFAVGALPPVPPMVLLVTGGLAATAGTLAVAGAESLAAALAGLACAAAGTAVLFPTLLAAGVGRADPALRGRATSVVSTTAYLGFLLGPVFVGRLADGSDLRAAMTGVAVLAAVCTVACWPALRAVRATHADVAR